MERKEVPAPAGADRLAPAGVGRLRWPVRLPLLSVLVRAATGRCRSLPPPLRSAPGPRHRLLPGGRRHRRHPPAPRRLAGECGGARPDLLGLLSSPSHPAVIN